MSGSSEVTATAGAGGDSLEEQLRAYEGRAGSQPLTGPDDVGQAMIRHFVDAVGDRNPVYLDEAAAVASGRPGVIAPPAMLQVWTMPTLRQKLAADAAVAAGERLAGGQNELMALLADHGCTAIVATDSEQTYHRELRIGDRVRSQSVIDTVSPEKRTALGPGYFVTVRSEYTAGDGDPVGTLLFRMLIYRPEPRTAPAAGADPEAPATARRPRPIVTQDTAFFFEGLRAGEIRIQRCAGCGALRHPPRPRCPSCGSYDFDTVAAAGTGKLHSWVVVHHPPMPGFEHPSAIGLVELTEGVRIVAELAGVDTSAVEIGTDLVAEVVAVDDGLSVPRFRPAGGGGIPGAATRRLVPGAPLPVVEVPLTRTAIVAGALATRDFQDVHHDHERARRLGSPDIFMNILTTNGYVGRLATDWGGPDAVIDKIAIRLGAPNYPGDTMRLSGEVAEVHDEGELARVVLAVRGANRLGDHVTGRVELRVPAAGAAS
jgi:uncharacterized OB-fold protein/acyl dehydratase